MRHAKKFGYEYRYHKSASEGGGLIESLTVKKGTYDLVDNLAGKKVL